MDSNTATVQDKNNYRLLPGNFVNLLSMPANPIDSASMKDAGLVCAGKLQ